MHRTRRTPEPAMSITPEPAWSAPAEDPDMALQGGGGGNALARERLSGTSDRTGTAQGGAGPASHLACGPGSGLSPSWEAFALVFGEEFRSVLHAFAIAPEAPGSHRAPVSEPAPAEVTTRGVGVGEQTGPSLSAEQLQRLFTPVQRDLLTDFACTGLIPERLFNGDERGATTAQQRILMSSHILSEGRYAPGSFEQDLHARMCYHWVQLVHHYAGVTPGAGPATEGVMGNFDHAGGVVLGTGAREGVYAGQRVNAADLPEVETPGGLGPPVGRHAEVAESHPERVFRRSSLPFERFDTLRPGDWLYYYNGNASGEGSHSVVFSRWTSGDREVDGVRFRDAVAFSQGNPSDGGREHTVRLGDRFAETSVGQVVPITMVSRATADAAPADSPDALVPSLTGRRAERLDASNERFLRGVERRVGRPIDPGMLRQWIREQNQVDIDTLGARLTEGQRALLEETNRRDDLETLVRLRQRLQQIAANGALLEANEEALYDRLDDEHDEAQAEAEAARERTRQALAEIDAELAPIEEQIAERTQRLEAIDQGDATLGLWRQARDLRRRAGALPNGPERERVMAERAAVLAEIQRREGQRDLHRPERSRLQRELVPLRAAARPLQRRRRAVVARQEDVEAELPHGSVHPGRLRGAEARGRTTGRLSDLRPAPPWEQLVAPEAPDAPPVTMTLD